MNDCKLRRGNQTLQLHMSPKQTGIFSRLPHLRTRGGKFRQKIICAWGGRAETILWRRVGQNRPSIDWADHGKAPTERTRRDLQSALIFLPYCTQHVGKAGAKKIVSPDTDVDMD